MVAGRTSEGSIVEVVPLDKVFESVDIRTACGSVSTLRSTPTSDGP